MAAKQLCPIIAHNGCTCQPCCFRDGAHHRVLVGNTPVHRAKQWMFQLTRPKPGSQMVQVSTRHMERANASIHPWSVTNARPRSSASPSLWVRFGRRQSECGGSGLSVQLEMSDGQGCGFNLPEEKVTPYD
eukprot:6490658-Amphidinium_carterae.1